MASVQKSIRLQENIVREIEQLAQERGRDFTAITNELLEEAVKMKRCPGIVFTEGTSGRRARIAGTGIEVWELIGSYKGVGSDYDRLRKAYHWLTDQQLRAAIGFYLAYPEDVEALLRRNEEVSPEVVRKRHPFLPAGAH
ncbi:MAG: DUF433 domain-containing protein [Deltaproteobacteria bacterium]|nr:DUF433 domain-containing protein [Deltaproteobacteria bacterium]